MATWQEFEDQAPVLAAAVKGRLEEHGLGLLATLRHDGSPRISGIEPLIAAGELWIGMMPGSRKGADLRRDSRFALHSATADKNVTEGDAKLSGRAVTVTDGATVDAFRAAFREHTGYLPEGPIELFRATIDEASFLRPAGDHLEIDSWRAGGPVQRRERR